VAWSRKVHKPARRQVQPIRSQSHGSSLKSSRRQQRGGDRTQPIAKTKTQEKQPNSPKKSKPTINRQKIRNFCRFARARARPNAITSYDKEGKYSAHHANGCKQPPQKIPAKAKCVQPEDQPRSRARTPNQRSKKYATNTGKQDVHTQQT